MKKRLLPASCFALLVFVPALLFGQTDSAHRVDLRQQQWFGNALCYSGFRERQHPDSGTYPSQAQIREDFKILEKHWTLIRTYGSEQHSRDILEVIRKEKIHLSVMLGAWLSAEPGNEASNAKQVAECIRLANEYRDIVVAVSIGNEILVDWSNHKMPEDKVIQYVRQVKGAVHVPVTVDDDCMYWIKPGRNSLRKLILSPRIFIPSGENRILTAVSPSQCDYTTP